MINEEKTYSGIIIVRAHGEDDDALYLDPPGDRSEYPLAFDVAADIEELGNTVTVSYWIADRPQTLEELIENEVRKLAGAADAEYHQHYSEFTGYLWTDEQLEIGGHDLLDELESNAGRWCLLSIKFGGRPS